MVPFSRLMDFYPLAENHPRESLIRSSSEGYAPHCSRTDEPMSALGQKQTSQFVCAMSALPGRGPRSSTLSSSRCRLGVDQNKGDARRLIGAVRPGMAGAALDQHVAPLHHALALVH